LPRLVVFGQSHLALRLGELTARLGLESIAVPLGEPTAPMRQAWGERLGLERPGTEAGWLPLRQLRQATAALFCDPQDAVNLSLALEVRDACPDLPLVISFFDPRLGRKIQQELGNCTVLSSAELSAPWFAAAALQRGVAQTVTHAGRPYAFLLEAPTERARWKVQDARFVALEELFEHLRDGAEPPPSLGDPLARIPRRFDRYLLGILALIALTLLAATAYFHYSQQLPWISALYFVVTTFCTVGYGDFSLRDASDLAKIAGIVLMLSSVTLTAALFAILTNALVGLRIDAQEGRRNYRLRNHVLVCGLGSMGLRVAECLQRLGAKVLVIDLQRDNPMLEELAAQRIPYMVADATRQASLKSAGIARARALVCALNDDLEGLEIGLAARASRPALRVVLRVFDGAFADRIERHFRIHTALSTSTIAAPCFLARALDPAAQVLLETGSGWWVIAERNSGDPPLERETVLVDGRTALVLAPLESLRRQPDPTDP